MSKNIIVEMALKSLIHEVSLYPKPGLVDPLDNGSHCDMDYYTFIDSIFALRPGFETYFVIGQNHNGTLTELFESIRQVGMINESNMFTITKNVNTHKGANFMYGILISAIAFLNYPDLETLQEAVKGMTKGITKKELVSKDIPKTHGEKIFKDYGFTGIRGEVEQGMPNAFDIGLKYINDIDYNTSLKYALIKIIQHNDDTNMIKRGGIEGLNYGKELAKNNFCSIDDKLEFMNDEFKRLNLSPGGSADLLAISIFLFLYKKSELYPSG